MIVLGLLLILVAAGAAVFAVVAPSSASRVFELTALGVTVSASPLAMFVTGALSVVLLGLGIAMMNGGMRRTMSSRKELRQLRKEQAAAGASRSSEAGDSPSRRDRLHESSSKDANTDSSRTDSSR